MTTCVIGYTEADLIAELGEEQTLAFYDWMHGQTYALCDMHGNIYYEHDVLRFIAGFPVVD